MTDRPIDAANWIARQPTDVREAGEARAASLIEAATLRDIRTLVRRTQVEVAAAMGTSRDRVSKLERGDDAFVSTLRRHVRALDGELRLLVEFPGRPAMTIDLDGKRAAANRVRAVRPG
jgi:transcriptional regulator with XRE-family HTH domain